MRRGLTSTNNVLDASTNDVHDRRGVDRRVHVNVMAENLAPLTYNRR